jgi:hypothetical protein
MHRRLIVLASAELAADGAVDIDAIMAHPGVAADAVVGGHAGAMHYLI